MNEDEKKKVGKALEKFLQSSKFQIAELFLPKGKELLIRELSFRKRGSKVRPVLVNKPRIREQFPIINSYELDKISATGLGSKMAQVIVTDDLDRVNITTYSLKHRDAYERAYRLKIKGMVVVPVYIHKEEGVLRVMSANENGKEPVSKIFKIDETIIKKVIATAMEVTEILTFTRQAYRLPTIHLSREEKQFAVKMSGEIGYTSQIMQTTCRMLAKIMGRCKLNEEGGFIPPPPLLLTGEPGLGKSTLVRAIAEILGQKAEFLDIKVSPAGFDDGGVQSKKLSFVQVNLPSIEREFFSGELFGKVNTNGIERLGRFIEARGGILFLDEIGEIDDVLQVKLLTALQEKQVYMIGASEPISVDDVWIIGATNKNEEALSRLRPDFFDRISQYKIEIPPLRLRKQDIDAVLKDRILKPMRKRLGREIQLEERVQRGLRNCRWPGNIREIERVFNYVEFHLEPKATRITLDHFDGKIREEILVNENIKQTSMYD